MPVMYTYISVVESVNYSDSYESDYQSDYDNDDYDHGADGPYGDCDDLDQGNFDCLEETIG